MNPYVDIGGSEALALKGALLVYQGKSRGFVTWHEARCDGAEGAPYLGEAQELTQDVFIQAMKKLDQLRVPEAFPGWLRSIANRMAINHLVRKRGDLAIEQEALEATCVERETPLAMALADERKTTVRQGLKKLGRLDRQTLVAFYVKGKSIDEMAGDFDAPEGTIKRRLHVARKRLAKEVAELAV